MRFNMDIKKAASIVSDEVHKQLVQQLKTMKLIRTGVKSAIDQVLFYFPFEQEMSRILFKNGDVLAQEHSRLLLDKFNFKRNIAQSLYTTFECEYEGEDLEWEEFEADMINREIPAVLKVFEDPSTHKVVKKADHIEVFNLTKKPLNFQGEVICRSGLKPRVNKTSRKLDIFCTRESEEEKNK